MYAALMKAYPDEKTIHASIWVHSGEWRMLEETVIPELNLNNCSSNIVRFRAEFILAGVRLVFRVNDKELIAVSDSSIVEDGDFGVRVMGSSFGFCNVHLKINQ
jgi:hypothetical protein